MNFKSLKYYVFFIIFSTNTYSSELSYSCKETNKNSFIYNNQWVSKNLPLSNIFLKISAENSALYLVGGGGEVKVPMFCMDPTKEGVSNCLDNYGYGIFVHVNNNNLKGAYTVLSGSSSEDQNRDAVTTTLISCSPI